jgi:hypothetical protein
MINKMMKVCYGHLEKDIELNLKNLIDRFTKLLIVFFNLLYYFYHFFYIILFNLLTDQN